MKTQFCRYFVSLFQEKKVFKVVFPIHNLKYQLLFTTRIPDLRHILRFPGCQEPHLHTGVEKTKLRARARIKATGSTCVV